MPEPTAWSPAFFFLCSPLLVCLSACRLQCCVFVWPNVIFPPLFHSFSLGGRCLGSGRLRSGPRSCSRPPPRSSPSTKNGTKEVSRRRCGNFDFVFDFLFPAPYPLPRDLLCVLRGVHADWRACNPMVCPIHVVKVMERERTQDLQPIYAAAAKLRTASRASATEQEKRREKLLRGSRRRAKDWGSLSQF